MGIGSGSDRNTEAWPGLSSGRLTLWRRRGKLGGRARQAPPDRHGRGNISQRTRPSQLEDPRPEGDR
eukprot:9025991-Alexandrium_andersonii.AAC.1